MIRTVSAALIAVALLSVSAATARPPTPAEEAARLLGLGVELQKAGRHVEALAIFDDAYAKVQHPKIRYYRMKSYQALGRVSEAWTELQAIIDDPELKDRRKELEAIEKTLRQALKPVRVRIEVPGIEGADVFVDGELRCTAPCSLELQPGHYLVEVKAAGYRDAAQRIHLAAGGSSQTLTLALEAAPEQPDPTPDPTPPPREEPNYWLPWTLIGGGIAAVAGSSGYWAKHAIDKGDLRPGDTQTPINLILGGVFTGVGAGLIVAGVLLLPDGEDPQDGDGDGADASVGAAPLSGGGMLWIEGRF